MYLILRRFVVSTGLIVLTACSSGRQWQHPTKTIYEFAANNHECQKLALASAQEASLVPQPVLDEFMSRYERCLVAQGWSPVEVTNYVPPEVNVVTSNEKLTFSTDKFDFILSGPYTLLSQQHNEFLTHTGETYLYLIFQLDYPTQLIREAPPKINQSTFFDQYQNENIFARFFSQYKDNQVIFSCNAYLFANDNNRVVISISKAFENMPENYMDLTAPQFEQLRSTQNQWQTRLQQLAEQFQ